MTTSRILEIVQTEHDYRPGEHYYQIKAQKEGGRIVMVDRIDNVVKIEEAS